MKLENRVVAVTERKFIMDITEADWDRIHTVNAKGLFFCLQRVAQVAERVRIEG